MSGDRDDEEAGEVQDRLAQLEQQAKRIEEKLDRIIGFLDGPRSPRSAPR